MDRVTYRKNFCPAELGLELVTYSGDSVTGRQASKLAALSIAPPTVLECRAGPGKDPCLFH